MHGADTRTVCHIEKFMSWGRYFNTFNLIFLSDKPRVLALPFTWISCNHGFC